MFRLIFFLLFYSCPLVVLSVGITNKNPKNL